MSTSAKKNYCISRARLLATVSTVALIASITGSEVAIASGSAADPTIWLEFGWHADRITKSTDEFAMPLDTAYPQPAIMDPIDQTLNLSRSVGSEGKITFEPAGTNWVFSASVRYGRAHGIGHTNRALPATAKTSFATFHTTIPTYPFPYHKTFLKPVVITQPEFTSVSVDTDSHFILDFQAGSDVGIGLFGRNSTSTISAGVRFAHLNVKHNLSEFKETGNVHFTYTQVTHPTYAFFPRLRGQND